MSGCADFCIFLNNIMLAFLYGIGYNISDNNLNGEYALNLRRLGRYCIMGFFSTLGDTREMLLYILTMVLMLGFIMPVHECAHGLMAKALGDDTAERARRLTLNPMAHLNLYGALMMFLIGFGWAEPVPVSPVRFRNQKRRQGYMALVAFAGPLSNLLMAFLGLIIFRAGLCFDMSYDFFYAFYFVMLRVVLLNVGLAVFNMLPIMPLDGSRILNWIMPDKLMYKIEQAISRVNPIVYIVVFYVAIQLLSGPLWTVEYSLFSWLGGVVDGLFNALGLNASASVIRFLYGI